MQSEQYQKHAKEMREWLNTRPHLPKDVSDNMLCRFAQSCYFDMDKAKETAEAFFTLRRDHPQMFTDRDPQSPHMKEILSAVKIARFEISEKRKLFLYQLADQRNFDMLSDAKLNFLVNDCWYLENEADFHENDVYYVADVKDLSFRFLWKVNMTVIKTYSKYQREAAPIRLKQIHFVNTPPVMNKIYYMFKNLLSKEVSNSIYFHPPNSNTLLNFFSKDDLPSDYGGNRPSMDTLMAGTMKLIEDKRDTVLSKDFWVATCS